MQPANTLYYGDNLGVLRKHIEDETVDLVYLDPPFNSNRDYNVLFKSKAANLRKRKSKPSRILGSGVNTPTWSSVRPAKRRK